MSDSSERHVRNDWPDTVCKGCRNDWPCDTELMRRERDVARADASAVLISQACDEANARADKAEAALAGCEKRQAYTAEQVYRNAKDKFQQDLQAAIQQRDRLAEAIREYACGDGECCKSLRAALDAIKEENDD